MYEIKQDRNGINYLLMPEDVFSAIASSEPGDTVSDCTVIISHYSIENRFGQYNLVFKHQGRFWGITRGVDLEGKAPPSWDADVNGMVRVNQSYYSNVQQGDYPMKYRATGIINSKAYSLYEYPPRP